MFQKTHGNESLPAVSSGLKGRWLQALIAGVVAVLALVLVPRDDLAAICASFAFAVMAWTLGLLSFQSVTFTVMGVVLAVGSASSLTERLAVPAAALLGLALMYSSLMRHQWNLGPLRVVTSLLIAAPGIAVLISDPTTASAGTALFAAMLAGSILAQMEPEWPLGAGLTFLSLCIVFLLIGWAPIASQIANAAFFSLLAAAVLSLAVHERSN